MIVRLGLVGAVHVASGVVLGGLAVLATAFLVEQGRQRMAGGGTARGSDAPPASPSPPSPLPAAAGGPPL